MLLKVHEGQLSASPVANAANGNDQFTYGWINQNAVIQPAKIDSSWSFQSVDATKAFRVGAPLGLAKSEESIPGIMRLWDIADEASMRAEVLIDIHPLNQHVSLISAWRDGFAETIHAFGYVDLGMVQEWLRINANPLQPTAQFDLMQLAVYLAQVGVLRGFPRQDIWCDHAGEGTEEVEVIPEITAHPYYAQANVTYKGNEPDPSLNGMIPDSYSSMFSNNGMPTRLAFDLTRHHAVEGGDTVVACWAGDFCPGFSALDSSALGLRTWFACDATANVSMPVYDPADPVATLEQTAFWQGLGLTTNAVITTENVMVARLIKAKVKFTNTELMANAV